MLGELGRTGGLLRSNRLAIGAVAAFVATAASSRGVSAFDKQTCAAAYESAQQLRNKLKLRKAHDLLLVCGHSTCPAVVTKDCNAWLEEVEAELTSVVLRARDARGQSMADVRVWVDGEHLQDKLDGSSVFVDPGMHQFRFESETSGAVEVRQMLRKGDRDRPIEATLKPRQAESTELDASKPDAGPDGGKRTEIKADDKRSEMKPPVEMQLTSHSYRPASPGTGTYLAAGVGAVALASFAYFGLKATSDAAELRRTCSPNCSQTDVDAVRSKLIVANVSLGVGVAALGVATILWIAKGSAAPKSTSAFRLAVVPAARGQGAEVTSTFTAP
jgi:hypothetical protein